MDFNGLDAIMETAASLMNERKQNIDNNKKIEMTGGEIKKKLGRPKKTSKKTSKKKIKNPSKKTSKKKSKKPSKKTSKKSSKKLFKKK